MCVHAREDSQANAREGKHVLPTGPTLSRAARLLADGRLHARLHLTPRANGGLHDPRLRNDADSQYVGTVKAWGFFSFILRPSTSHGHRGKAADSAAECASRMCVRWAGPCTRQMNLGAGRMCTVYRAGFPSSWLRGPSLDNAQKR